MRGVKSSSAQLSSGCDYNSLALMLCCQSREQLPDPSWLWGYRDGSPTAVQAWRPCPLWETSPRHPIL